MSRKASQSEKHWAGVAHIRIPLKVLDSPAWRVMDFSEKALYTDLRAKLRSTNNGNINAVFSEMKHRGWNSDTTLRKCLRVLIHMGFIVQTRRGGIAAMSKVCNLYGFTDYPIAEHRKQGIEAQPPTNSYERFKSVKEAEAEIQKLKDEIKREKAVRKKSKPQNLTLVAPNSVGL